VDSSGPGILRRRRGRGFEYLDESGERIDDAEVLERIRGLVIPPAWNEVWICPDPLGHIQALGTDAAGRRQYLYHVRWRERRDREKFDEMLRFARILPQVRKVAGKHLKLKGMPRERALACAVRLLDRGFFRIGTEDYAEQNQTYGLATMQKRHVTLSPGGLITFDYVAKGGKRHIQSLVDPDVFRVVEALKRRRTGHELLAYRNGRAWVDVRSDDINAYIKEVTRDGYSAKDFRTSRSWALLPCQGAATCRWSPPLRSKIVPENPRSGPTYPSPSSASRFITHMESILEAIGNTPLVRLRRCAPSNGAGLERRLPLAQDPEVLAPGRCVPRQVRCADDEGMSP
jgi:DNA topoisomerase-1